MEKIVKNSEISILIVEDIAENLFYLKTFLNLYFTNIFTAEDGLIGLEQYNLHKPDIVLSDISMPNLDGIAMAERIRAENPKAQIILQTAFDNKESFISAINIGVDHFLIKPVSDKKLFEALNKSIAIIKLEREVELQYDSIEKLSLVVEQNPNPTLILDSYGHVEYCNKSFLHITGFLEKDVINNDMISVLGIHDSDEFGNNILSAIRNSEELNGEYRASFDRGNFLDFALSLSLIVSSKETYHFSVTLTNITKRIKAQIELQKAHDELETRVIERTSELKASMEFAANANKAKTSFLAKVSHELRTPLNGIIGLTSILQGTNLSKKQIKFVNMLRESGNNLLSIINDILDYSKLDSGKIIMEEIYLILEVCVKNSVEMLEKKAANKGLNIKLNIENDLPERLIGDPVRIQQIIQNILNNAIKFTDKGEIEINVSKKDENDKTISLLFSIKDTGIGIPVEKIDSLFTSFQQVENYLTRKRGGTGLGLAISKEIIKMMNGKIWVESVLNSGSTFYFTIELKKVKETQDDAIVSLRFEEDIIEIYDKYYIRKLDLLVAENSLVNLELLEEGLTVRDWNIMAVTNGVDAVAIYKSKRFDIVLMDIQMPEMDGLEATQLIRNFEKEHDYYTPIIGITALANQIEKKEYLSVGIDDFIVKPFDWEQLFKTIHSYMLLPVGKNNKTK